MSLKKSIFRALYVLTGRLYFLDKAVQSEEMHEARRLTITGSVWIAVGTVMRRHKLHQHDAMAEVGLIKRELMELLPECDVGPALVQLSLLTDTSDH